MVAKRVGKQTDAAAEATKGDADSARSRARLAFPCRVARPSPGEWSRAERGDHETAKIRGTVAQQPGAGPPKVKADQGMRLFGLSPNLSLNGGSRLEGMAYPQRPCASSRNRIRRYSRMRRQYVHRTRAAHRRSRIHRPPYPAILAGAYPREYRRVGQ